MTHVKDNGSSHHGKVDVIDHCMGITGLALAAANLLFDLLETGFYFPPRTIVLDDLFNGQIQVSRKEGNSLCFTKDPDYPDRAFGDLEKNNLPIKEYHKKAIDNQSVTC